MTESPWYISPTRTKLPDLAAEVMNLVQQVPRGRVSTYGELARALGDDKARAARWLGELLKSHPHDAQCVCHRIVRSNGEVGLHVSGETWLKSELLREEGVKVSNEDTVAVNHLFRDFRCRKTLQELREFQRDLSVQATLTELPKLPTTVAGLDVAYAENGVGWGAYVELSYPQGEVLLELSTALDVNFPYIPGYLTFRELPILLRLCELVKKQQGQLADVLFVDGNGRLHPWRAGIATCLGVMLNHATIGVGKSLLCGSVDLENVTPQAPQPVCDGGELIGLAMKAKAHSRPIFPSVGHGLSWQDCEVLTRNMLSAHRIPEPVYHADRLTKLSKTPPDA